MQVSSQCRNTVLEEKKKKKTPQNRNPQKVLNYSDMSIKVQSYEIFSHPLMLTGKKKTGTLSPFSRENWLKDSLLKEKKK